MRLAASGAPVVVKRRTVDRVHKLKILPVFLLSFCYVVLRHLELLAIPFTEIAF
jgi:hypothetical protein